MSNRIQVNVVDHVADVVLNRPEKHNAVDRDMFEAFGAVGQQLASDRSIRAVVLRGSGENFCAGIDISTFSSDGIDPQLMAPGADTPANFFQRAAYVWRELPVPVIAALHGVVFGAGLQIALGTDVRISAPNAQLSIMETKWGIIPDMASMTSLPALVSYDKAMELTWSGRIVSGEEAAGIGLVTSLHDDPVARAKALAESLCHKSPDAVRAAKQLYLEAYADRDAQLLRREAELQMAVMAGANQAEAVAANLQKRAPEFADSTLGQARTASERFQGRG
ncbi:MAG: crotonase/enoyl-CoA hydratase family protein [Pseudomonadota bacterium]